VNLSSFGRRLLQAVDAATFGTILGLGTAAYKNTGTSGNTVPLLDGANTWSAIQTFSAKPSLTGGAISFPATQVASAGANDLDDYEEGTWTPALDFGGASVGITYTTQSGTYTKVGRKVFVGGRVTLSNKGSSAGNVSLSGLPFTSSGLFSVAIGTYLNMASLTDGMVGFVNASATTLQIRTGGAASSLNITDANFTNTSDIIFSATYQV
jgi:hypothetical protein